MTRILNKLRIEGMYLTIIKANRTNPQLTSHSLVKAEHFKNALWSFLFNVVLEVLAKANRAEKKRHQNCKFGSKIVFFQMT